MSQEYEEEYEDEGEMEVEYVGYKEYEDSDEDEVEYYAIRPNKTQIKKEFATLFDLGEEMSRLSEANLNKLELPDVVHKAVMQVAGMPPKGARKRLLKYIAAQLHKIDVTPITEKLAKMKNKSAHAVREHHIVERWRDSLIAEGDVAVTELLDEHPHADRQLVRQLVRNAQKEAQNAKPPKSSRQLYRYLKELFEHDSHEESSDDDSYFEDELEDE